MKSKTQNMSLSDMLTAYSKASAPLSDEYIEKRVNEVFGNSEQFTNNLKNRIQSAIDSVVKSTAPAARKGA